MYTWGFSIVHSYTVFKNIFHAFQVHGLMYVFFNTSLQLLNTNWERHINEYKSADEWLPPAGWLIFFCYCKFLQFKRNTGDLKIESKSYLFFDESSLMNHFWWDWKDS